VLISGAGVAGPALAFWLHRHGYTVTIVERSPAPRLGGQAVDLRGPARIVAERMGLLPEIRVAHTGVRGMAFVNQAGERLVRLSADLFGHSAGPIADIEILRADLVGILHAATENEIEYVFGDRIVHMAQDDEGVHVDFESGASQTFDLVVGADGLHSGVRRQLFGNESAFVRELGACVAICTVPAPVPLEEWVLMHTVPGRSGARGKTVGVYPVRGEDRVIALFYFAAVSADRHATEPASQITLVAHAFADVGWIAPHLLNAMPEAHDFFFERARQVHMSEWARGRVVLLGDAAHCASPMGGHGASMALVGAYVLAGALVAAGSDYRAAFARYQSAMREYVAGCQRVACESADFLLPRSRTRMWFRDQSLRLLPHVPGRERIVAAMQSSADQIPLAEYAA
jgi:2-polyprenyl-6-methoxyphenol hydroxylase-like FAD-dependent oxidoreductase